MPNNSKFFISLIFLLLFAFGAPVYAEEVNADAAKERRTQLEKDLNNIEVQINGYSVLIEQKQNESASLERDIAIYDAQIKKAKLEIKKLDLDISQTLDGIGKKTGQIKTLADKKDQEKESLAELIRKANELDSVSLGELVLGYQKFSDFFVVADSFETIHRSIQNSIGEIISTTDLLEKQKDELQDRKAEQVRLRAARDMEKRKLADTEEQKKQVLKVTKGLEKNYQSLLSARKKDAAKIRSQLFLLSGSPSIPFEKAVEYASLVWKKLNIRPAFLLGIIAEESSLGANIGKGNWKEDLSSDKCAKQRAAFVSITSELGLDPDLMPVSKKTWYGYCGGAMGPAQFMPTTWLGYKPSISKITSSNPPNPWNPKDAFVASGLLLKDNGASVGGYEAERRAALRYLAGGNWNKPSYRFYGDDVMDLAAKYQEQIDIINK